MPNVSFKILGTKCPIPPGVLRFGFVGGVHSSYKPLPILRVILAEKRYSFLGICLGKYAQFSKFLKNGPIFKDIFVENGTNV